MVKTNSPEVFDKKCDLAKAAWNSGKVLNHVYISVCVLAMIVISLGKFRRNIEKCVHDLWNVLF